MANYWVNLGVPRSKLVIGMATYGRGFALDDKNNFYVGALIKGSSPAGSFTREAGFMAYYEVSSPSASTIVCIELGIWRK